MKTHFTQLLRKLPLFFLSLVLGLFIFAQMSFAQGKVFTAEELSTYNGKDGAKSYTAYKGVVYDVSESTLWKLGEHFGLQAGIDLTEKMAEAPHGAEVFEGFTVVGSIAESAPPAPEKPEAVVATQEETTQEAVKSPWYAKKIRVLGFSILGWTGIVLGVFFVLTFATCFALPWAQLPLPWKGLKIGPDPLDDAGTHMKWSSVHKYFVWVTVVVGIIHGIIGFLQMLGIYF